MNKQEILSKADRFGFDVQLQKIVDRYLSVDIGSLSQDIEPDILDPMVWNENPCDFYPSKVRFLAMATIAGESYYENDMDQASIYDFLETWDHLAEQHFNKVRDLCADIIVEYDLDAGNSEVPSLDFADDDTELIIEAPNHWTLVVNLNLKKLISLNLKDCRNYILQQIFVTTMKTDANEKFEDLWSNDFAQHTGYTAFQFADMLKDDKVFYDNLNMQVDETLTKAGLRGKIKDLVRI